VVTAGGEIVQIETRRDTTLLRLLMGIMGLSSAKDVPFDTILRTITARTSVELDLNQTLSELRIGPNAMLFLQGNHRLAAAREFSDPSSLSGPSGFELPRGATGRVLALTDETPAQPGAGAGAGTGAGSGSTGGGGSGSARQALTVTFVAAFKEQYEASRGRLMSLWVTNFAATLTGPTDDQYKQIRTHVTSDPTCRTADIVRSILAKPDYAPLKPDFSPSV
jgi:hypothetical protein